MLYSTRHHPPKNRNTVFCSKCGSSILFKSTKWQGEIHITLANLNLSFDIKPQAHAYFDTHVDWLNFDDGIKRIDGLKTVKK